MPRTASRRPPRSGALRSGRVGLALAGGGFLGAAYELGVLAALSESLEGIELHRLDAYVGVSAGAFIAAGLANGKTPHQMVRMFVEDETEALDPASMLRPARHLLARLVRSAPVAAQHVLEAGISEGGRGVRAVLWQALERVGRMMPAGLLDAGQAERTLERIFAEPGRTNDFRGLSTILRIVATDIDNGRPVEFGARGFDDVPITRAVVASSAMPGLFPPVRIGGRFYVDGALNKTLHASVALNEGVGLLLCINPLVPYTSPSDGAAGRIAHASLPVVLSQSIRTAIRSRMTVGLEKYRITHPHARIVLFEPRSDDANVFFTSIFTLGNRRRVCEQAYQQTRSDLLARRETLEPMLAPFGIGLNLRVLHDPDLRLVRSAPPPRGRRVDGFEDGMLRLRHTLDDLERSLRVSPRND